MNTNIKNTVADLLSIPKPNVSGVNTPNIVNKGAVKLFISGDTTRNIMYRYATISSTGNIAFHVMSPYTFIDESQNQAQYKKKTIYASVNMDTNPRINPNTQEKTYGNNNLGNYLVSMKKNFLDNTTGKKKPNPYNALELLAPVIKQALIPTDISKLTMQYTNNNGEVTTNLSIINAPAIKLQKYVTEVKANEDIESKDKTNAYIEAFKEYQKEVFALYENGLLDYSFILINPTPNTVNFAMGLEPSMNSMSNVWLNYNELMNQGLPISNVPVTNHYSTVVQIVESADASVFYSDNEAMFGEKVIYTNDDTQKSRKSISLVGIIKDYNSDTPILVNVTDTAASVNSTDPNARGRVDSLTALLDKGINTFTVHGALSPVVRTIDSNSARNGNVFFQLLVDTYEIYQSSNMRSSLENDAFDDLEISNIELDEEDVQTLSLDSDHLTDALLDSDVSVNTTSTVSTPSKGKGKGKSEDTTNLM